MMLSPSRSGGSVTGSQPPEDTGGGDPPSMEPSRSDSWSILLTFEKVDDAQRAPDFPKDLAVRMPSVDRRSRLSQVEPELLVFC
jgi:hypothetical protein